MYLINLTLVEKLLEVNYNIDELECFKKDFLEVKKITKLNYEWLLNPKKIPTLKKDKQIIIDFISKYKSMITTFQEKNLLWEMTDGFDLHYHWNDCYRNIILDIKKTGKQKVLKTIQFLKNNGYEKINYVVSFYNRYYESFLLKHKEEKYEIEYYMSDGDKFYLAQYYLGSYPVIFKNAKIVLEYHSDSFLSNKKIAYLTTFDIDVDKIKCISNNKEILNNVPFDDIEKISKVCTQIRNLEKQISAIETAIVSTKKLCDYQDLHESVSEQLKKLDDILIVSKKMLDDFMTEYSNLEYGEETIKLSLEYLKQAEYEAAIDID